MANNATTKFDYLRDMLGTPLGGKVEREQRSVPITEKVISQLKPETKIGEETYWGTPTEEAKISTLPVTMGGQYIADPSQADMMFKFDREVPERLKRYARQGLPSYAFQVDHIIPLSLGGTNDKTNLQVLDNKTHDTKTKVGAVVNELYFNKKIGLNDARNKVINFKGLNVDDIVLNSEGRVPVELAEQAYNSWGEVPKVGVKDWLKELKGAPGYILGKAGEKTGEIMPETPLGEFGKGFTEEMALGFIDAGKHEYETEKEQLIANIARGAGKVSGFMLSFALMYGAASVAAKAALGTKLLKGTTFAKWIVKANKPIKATVGTKKIIWSANRTLRVLKNAGAFTLHGQLSKQQEAGFDNRVKRFFSDAAFGSVLAIPGQTMKGYAGLAASVYTLSALEGSSPAEALMNTAIVTGLHGVGGIHQKFVTQNEIDLIVTDAAAKFLKKWGIEPKKIYRDSIKAEAQMKRERGIGVNKIMNQITNLEEARNEILKMLVAQRQMYKGGMGREKRLLEDVADLKSIVQRTIKLKPTAIENMPSEAIVLTDSTLNRFYSKQQPSKITRKVSDFPTDNAGVPTTGTARSNAPMTARDMEALQKLGVKDGDRVIVYRTKDPKTIEFVKKQNEKLPEAQRDSNPENILNVVMIKNGKVYRMGNIPTEKKIGSVYDPITGEKIRTVAGEYEHTLNKTIVDANNRYGSRNLQQADPINMNKNVITEAMNNRGWDYVVGEVHGVPSGMGTGVASGENWGRVRFTPQTIEESIKYNEAVNLVKSRGTGEATAKINQAIDSVVAAKPKAQEAIASDAIARIAPSETADSLYLTVKSFEEQLAGKGSAKTFVEKNVAGLTNTTIKPEMKKAIENSVKKNNLKVSSYIEFLGREKANNKLNEKGNTLYEYLLGPGSTYVSLNPTDRIAIGNLRLEPSRAKIEKAIEKTGQIQQKISLEKMGTKQKVTIGTERLSPEVKTINFQEEQTYKNLFKSRFGLLSKEQNKLAKDIAYEIEGDRTAAPFIIGDIEYEGVKGGIAKYNKASKEIKNQVDKILKAEARESLRRATPSSKKLSDFKVLATKTKTFSPKIKHAESIAREYETTGKNALDHADVGKQGRGSMSIKDYGAKLKSNIETLNIPISRKIPATIRLNNTEIANIKKSIKPRLYQHALNLLRTNFEPKSQAEFTGKTVADIEKQFLTALGMGKTKKRIELTKRDLKKKWDKEAKSTETILSLLGKIPWRKEGEKLSPEAKKIITKPRTKNIKEVQTLLEKNIKKFKGKDSYAEGFNTMLHKGLEKIFGKNYASGKDSWALNSFFSLNTGKGKLFWERMGLKLTPKGGTEAQPKYVTKAEYEMLVEKGKPYTEWTQKERDLVYGRRKKEAITEAKSREKEKKIKLTGEAKEAVEAGLSIGDRKVSDFVTDLSGFDLITKMRLARETGKKMNAKAGAVDAKSFLLEIQKTFNSYKPKGSKKFADFSELQAIVNKFKPNTNAIIEKEKKIDVKTFKGIMGKKKINFQEEQTLGYKNRTIKNASADATIHLATNFSVPGELLTKKSVLSQNKKYIPIDAKNLKVTKERVDKIVEYLNSANIKTLNIAGNGIYDMKGYTQKQIDGFTYDLLKEILNSPKLKNRIERIRSGGQTGFDEAGAKAGIRLGLPTTILAPKGWAFRKIKGVDISNEKLFKERFDVSVEKAKSKLQLKLDERFLKQKKD